MMEAQNNNSVQDQDGNNSKPLSVAVKISKCNHNWKTNVVEQYQQCIKCGKGHAL